MGVTDSKDFCCYECFAEEIVDNMSNVEWSIDIVGYYYSVRKIIRELILNGCSVGNIELYDEECCGYNDAFVVTVSKVIDGEYSIWCEPMLREGNDRYIYCESDIAYVFDYCNSRILKSIHSPVIYDIYVDEYDYEDELECIRDDADNAAYINFMQSTLAVNKSDVEPKTDTIKMDDDMKGFTISTSEAYGNSTFSFHYTDVNLVKAMLKEYGKF